MGLSAASRISQAQRLATSGVHGPWLPQVVPQVDAGYYWLAASAVDHGEITFNVPEGNGNTTHDISQAVVASQPTVLTESGGTQFRMRSTADPNPSLPITTLLTVQAGWTGTTYLGMWLRIPDAGGDITSGNATPFGHNLTAGNQRRVNVQLGNGTPDFVVVTSSADGLNQSGNNIRVASQTNGSWQWFEVIWDLAFALGGTSPTDYCKFFVDLVRITPNTLNPTTAPATLFDALAKIVVGSPVAAANGLTLDWAAVYYANGIPSFENREALRRHLAPA